MDLLEKIQGDKFYLIDFYAAWCAPCKMQVEILDDLQTKLPKLSVGKINKPRKKI